MLYQLSYSRIRGEFSASASWDMKGEGWNCSAVVLKVSLVPAAPRPRRGAGITRWCCGLPEHYGAVHERVYWLAVGRDTATLPEVERAGGLTYGRIGNTVCRLVDAAILRATLLPLCQEAPELCVVRLSDSQFVWE